MSSDINSETPQRIESQIEQGQVNIRNNYWKREPSGQQAQAPDDTLTKHRG